MTKLITGMCGVVNPLSLEDYKANGGFKALEKALEMKSSNIIKEVEDSKLVGRGGAAFPSGLKLKFVANEVNDVKYVICNADEGEPGTFKDKYLLNNVPFQVLEGMIIAAYTVGASKGYIYIRGEYPDIKDLLKECIKTLKDKGYLGDNVLDTDFTFDIELRSGTGAYVCGEETALIQSIEGRHGDPRLKPPYTAIKGLWDKPTLVSNVESLVNIIPIIEKGANYYSSIGTDASKGTKLFSVSGCVHKKGVYEIEFGTTLRELIYDYCEGIEDNKDLKFVQVGGSTGPVLPPSLLDTPLSFEAFKAMNYGLGSGAIFVADESTCILEFLKATMEFFKHESCGKCVPCREGNRHIVTIIDRIMKGKGKEIDLELLDRLSNLMMDTAFCGLGQTAPTPLLSALEYYRDEIHEHINGSCRTGSCQFGKGAINHV